MCVGVYVSFIKFPQNDQVITEPLNQCVVVCRKSWRLWCRRTKNGPSYRSSSTQLTTWCWVLLNSSLPHCAAFLISRPDWRYGRSSWITKPPSLWVYDTYVENTVMINWCWRWVSEWVSNFLTGHTARIWSFSALNVLSKSNCVEEIRK